MSAIDVGIGKQGNQIDAMKGIQDIFLLHPVKFIL
jgi:hypothetical protein